MTKNEFIKRYNETTKHISDNKFPSCWSIEKISQKCLDYYALYLGSRKRFWYETKFNKDGWECDVGDFNETDRMFAMELFFHACLTEKWYKEF